jgi:hypothetical protein
LPVPASPPPPGPPSPLPRTPPPPNPLGGKPASTAAAKDAPGQARQITWEELVPKDWDPAKEFKGMDLSALDDGDPKANDLLMKMQEVSNNAPTNAAMNGVEVKIPGFIVPLEEAKGEVTEFLLVPYFGACIHTPPPPANQILHVVPQKGRQVSRDGHRMGHRQAADAAQRFDDGRERLPRERRQRHQVHRRLQVTARL